MPKFCGNIGFIETVETDPENAPGVCEEVLTIRKYRGDVIQNSRRWEQSQFITTNQDLNITNRFSIIADAYANSNFHAMKFIEWMGSRWKINNVEVGRPRLTLYVGGLYNG